MLFFAVFWCSQVVPCARTAVPFRRYETATNTPARFTTGRLDPGALVPKTPQPRPSTPPWASVAVRVPARWECRLVRSSASGSTWDRCHPRSKLLLFLPPMKPLWLFVASLDCLCSSLWNHFTLVSELKTRWHRASQSCAIIKMEEQARFHFKQISATADFTDLYTVIQKEETNQLNLELRFKEYRTRRAPVIFWCVKSFVKKSPFFVFELSLDEQRKRLKSFFSYVAESSSEVQASVRMSQRINNGAKSFFFLCVFVWEGPRR